MQFLFLIIVTTLFSHPALARDPQAEWLTQVSPLEQAEIEARIEAFYKTSDPNPMQTLSPKFSLHAQQFVKPNPFLKLSTALSLNETNPLLRLAQVKGTQKFQDHYCQTF